MREIRPESTEEEMRKLALASGALLLSSCASRVPRSMPVVVVDNRWNEDYAKNICYLIETKPRPDEYCEEGQVRDVRLYTIQIASFFAKDSSCSGILLARSIGDLPKPTPPTESTWQLMLDFSPNNGSNLSVQAWTLINRADVLQMATGEDNPEQMAHRICSIVRKTGGTVLTRAGGAAQGKLTPAQRSGMAESGVAN